MAINMEDVTLKIIRPNGEPNAVQIDAYIGDLYLGQRTYYAQPSILKAQCSALNYITQHGSLN